MCFLLCLARCSDLVNDILQPGKPVHWKTLPLPFFLSFLAKSVALEESAAVSSMTDFVIESASDLSSVCSAERLFIM